VWNVKTYALILVYCAEGFVIRQRDKQTLVMVTDLEVPSAKLLRFGQFFRREQL
jgi:hypothetical protein